MVRLRRQRRAAKKAAGRRNPDSAALIGASFSAALILDDGRFFDEVEIRELTLEVLVAGRANGVLIGKFAVLRFDRQGDVHPGDNFSERCEAIGVELGVVFVVDEKLG